MFSGEFRHTLDHKGRLAIPARFRQDFEAGLVVTRGIEKCLFIFTLQGWEAYVATLNQLPLDKKRSRTVNRYLFSGANKHVPDGQGRILLPANLREFAGLDDEVVVVGANYRLEVWAPDKWQAILEEAEKDIELIMEELPDLRMSL